MAYRICVAHIHFGPKIPHMAEVVKHLKEALLTLDVRWNVAGTSFGSSLLS